MSDAQKPARTLSLQALDAWEEAKLAAYKKQAEEAEVQKGFMTAPLSNYPLLSDGAGVHPAQIESARESARKKGVSIDFTPDGQAIFTSARHRKEYCRLHGIHDKDGGFSDP